MKKSLLTERFQQLAGIKPIYELDETQNDGTPAAKQISTNKPLRNNILKYIESKLKPGQSVEKLFQMEDVAKEYIKNYVTEKEPHYKAIADSKDDMHMWYQVMQQHLQGSLDEELKENEGRELDVVDTDNRDSTYTVLRLSNGDYVEVNVLELYQNLLDNQDEE